MFDDIINKIRVVAKIELFVGIGLSIVVGLILFFSRDFLNGIVYALAGGFGSYVAALLIYGFSNIIENTEYVKSFGKINVNSDYSQLTAEELQDKYLKGELDGATYLNLLKEKNK